MTIAYADQVDRFYDAIAGGDLPNALALLGELEWHEAHGMPYRTERPYRGAAEIADRVLSPMNFDVENLTLTVERILELGSHIAVLGHYTGIARASRQAIDQPFLHVWTIDDEGIPRELRHYTEGARFRDALGAVSR